MYLTQPGLQLGVRPRPSAGKHASRRAPAGRTLRWLSDRTAALPRVGAAPPVRAPGPVPPWAASVPAPAAYLSATTAPPRSPRSCRAVGPPSLQAFTPLLRR